MLITSHLSRDELDCSSLLLINVKVCSCNTIDEVYTNRQAVEDDLSVRSTLLFIYTHTQKGMPNNKECLFTTDMTMSEGIL